MTGLENKILYVDMDGVLARWEDASYRDVSSEGFFLSRKPELNLIDAVRLIFELDVDVHILSSVLDNEFALKEKRVAETLVAMVARVQLSFHSLWECQDASKQRR